MLASKFFDDVYYNNAYYARVGGISNTEVRTNLFLLLSPRAWYPLEPRSVRCVQVNSLEMEMLRMISFSLFVEPEAYER